MRSSAKITICVAEARLSPAAREDLRQIRTYSKSAFGTRRALANLEGLRATFERLRAHPLIAVEEGDLGEDIRSIGYRAHRIYYQVMSRDVLVVRGLHNARDVRHAMTTHA